MSFIPRCPKRRSRWSSSKRRSSSPAISRVPSTALRALDLALLPAGGPGIAASHARNARQRDARRSKQFYTATIRPDLTTIVVIGDVSAEEAESVIEKWFGDGSGRPEARHTLPPCRPISRRGRTCADPQAVQDSVYPGRAIGAQPLRSGLLSPAARQSRARRRILCNAPLPRPAPGRRLRLYRRCAPGCLEDTAGYAVTYGCDPSNVSKARALIERDLERCALKRSPTESCIRQKR